MRPCARARCRCTPWVADTTTTAPDSSARPSRGGMQPGCCSRVGDPWAGVRSAHVVEVDDEDERLPRGDRGTGATLAVGEVGGDRQLAATTDLHALDALVPAGDDHADAEAEVERVAPVPRGVELLARRVGDADVVRADGV